MINLFKLEKITYGMTKDEISNLLKAEDLVFQDKRYVGAYSDIQLTNYMIDTISFEVIFKFSPLNNSLQSLLIKNSTLDDNEKYSIGFDVTKQELEKSLKLNETRTSILGGKKATWQSDVSDYELHFSEYSKPTSSFLCLSVNHKK